ncbi:DUF393 domain-containing protein [Bacillus smithii]|uniref:thiol-disulfide oxidoreductase DCC family protein n=1 Tax=Bacillus smithii TaxID=1479 RepID=UPI002E1A219D|nr:DUF393 domain-containing protein [Bacillus smithii]MED1456357.1 DUF393 domain-containing protein [Bacillus smithii]
MVSKERWKIIVLYDGWCGLCTGVANKWSKLDWFSLIEFRSFRDHYEKEHVALSELSAEMHARLKSNFQYVKGFDAFWLMAKRTPVLWLFLPLFYILKASRLGEWAYKKIAKKRKIVPDSLCNDGTCERKQPF